MGKGEAHRARSSKCMASGVLAHCPCGSRVHPSGSVRRENATVARTGDQRAGARVRALVHVRSPDPHDRFPVPRPAACDNRLTAGSGLCLNPPPLPDLWNSCPVAIFMPYPVPRRNAPGGPRPPEGTKSGHGTPLFRSFAASRMRLTRQGSKTTRPGYREPSHLRGHGTGPRKTRRDSGATMPESSHDTRLRWIDDLRICQYREG